MDRIASARRVPWPDPTRTFATPVYLAHHETAAHQWKKREEDSRTRGALAMVLMVGRGCVRGIVLYENQLPLPLAPVVLLPRCARLPRRLPAPGRLSNPLT